MPPRDLIDELLEGRVKATLFGGDRAPRLGRLVILEPIGAGAMGTVFAAYDPRLDRRVAVKLVRGGGDAANQRVLAEARALGALNHPNVVAVHDADEVDGSVYIVMELAPGAPLRAWIGAGHHWRDTVAVLRQAAVGLAAAHRAHLIHRDIKPDNILIGPDRVRLVDFGLASRRDGDAAGVSAGTPNYMAPETLAGEPATEASDQFSFGVTLFEALYGERPHTGANRAALALAAQTAAQARRPAGTAVPGWLHAIAVRALAAEPRDRFPAMAAVVDELGRDRRRRRRIASASAGVLAALAITGVVAYRGGSSTARDPCAGAAARRDAALPGARLAEVGAALARAAWADKAVADLDQHADRWEVSFRRVCEATRVRGEQTDTLYALRMRCLDRRLDRLATLAAEIARGASADPDEVSSAIGALADPGGCEAVTDPGELALPDDPAARTRVLAAEHELDRAWAAYVLARYADARGQLAAIEAAVAGLDAAALTARLDLIAGSIEARTGEPAVARARLESALRSAAIARAPELEAEVWTRILRGELFAGAPGNVVEWAPFARAAAARAGLAGAEVDGIVGEALRDAGSLAPARELLTRALATTDPLRGDQRALIEMNLGSVELAAGHPAAAERMLTRALADATAQLGADHPGRTLYLDKLAALARMRGQVRAALDAHVTAQTARRTSHGDADRSIATGELRKAQTAIEAGLIGLAEASIAEARRIRTSVYGAGHVRLGEIELAAGDAALAAGRTADARAAFTAAATLDPRIDVRARRARLGDRVAIDPLAAGDELTVDRAVAVAARIARLPAFDARTEAANLVERWRAAGPDLAAAVSSAVGAATLAAGDRTAAAEAFTAALAALADEPSRMRLDALIGLADAGTGPASRDAATMALHLLDELRELDQTPRVRLQRLLRGP